MRLFIALDLSPAVRNMLAALQVQLQQHTLPVRWAAPEGMHLTLRFLGDTAPDCIPAIGDAMRSACADIPLFALVTGAIGAFPDMRQPAVLWVGVGGVLEPLLQTHAALTSALEPLGFAPEPRSFRPHLTLGRVLDTTSAVERTRIATALRSLAPIATCTWPVEQVILYRSDRTPQGMRYTALDSVQLR